MFQNITLEDLFKQKETKDMTLIDVRSPKEFDEFRIPGSKNIPIFTNEERAEVGTLYKQVGPEAAKDKGLEIFSTKLPDFIASFKSIPTEKAIYCWRGGMRSKTAATVLDLMDIPVYRLSGGIKSYRDWVVNTLEKENFQPQMYVLNGYTGTGKTILLKRLEQLGYPILDLEGLANHRGSIFGQIGLEPNNQKTFESLLVQELIRYKDVPLIFLEGESKRIGKATIPDFLYNQKENGVQLFIDLPLDVRIQNILEEYHPLEHKAQFIEAFQIIKKRIHTPIAKQIDDHIHQSNFEAAIKLLLTYYYDPKYKHSNERYSDNQTITIHAKNLDEAFEKIINIMEQKEEEQLQ